MITKGLALLVAIILLSPVAFMSPDEGNGELIIARGTDAPSLDPRATTAVYAIEVCEAVFNSLVYSDRDTEIVLDLAKDYEIKDDDVTYIFELREDVTFHDGEPLTAEDVVFTYETILDPAFGSPHKERVDAIETIEALDEYTVKIKIDEPHAAFMDSLDVMIVPKHAAPSDPFADVDPDVDEEIERGVFAHEPIGSGPFKVVDWSPEDQVVLERYEDYHEGPAKLERIVRRIIPEDEAQYADLMGGRIHVGFAPEQEYDALDADPDFTVIHSPTLNYFPLYMNHDYDRAPMFEDFKVRKAINKAADYDAIVEHVWETALRVHTPIVQDTWAYDPDSIRVYDHDPERARELLAEAGYPDGLEVEIIMSDSTTNVELGEMLDAYYMQAGIDLQVNTMDFGTMLDRVVEGDYEMAHVGMVGMTDPDEFMQRFESGDGAGNYSNEELDEYIREARRTVDDLERRKELYSKAQAHISENAVDVPLFNSVFTIIMDSDVVWDYHYVERWRNIDEVYWDN